MVLARHEADVLGPISTLEHLLIRLTHMTEMEDLVAEHIAELFLVVDAKFIGLVTRTEDLLAERIILAVGVAIHMEDFIDLV